LNHVKYFIEYLFFVSDNILLCNEGDFDNIKICDFGISLECTEGVLDHGLTVCEENYFIYPHFPPESLIHGPSEKKVSKKIDVYAIGIVFFTSIYPGYTNVVSDKY